MQEVIHSDLYEKILEKNDKSVVSHVAMDHHTRVLADCAVGDCQLGNPVNYLNLGCMTQIQLLASPGNVKCLQCNINCSSWQWSIVVERPANTPSLASLKPC